MAATMQAITVCVLVDENGDYAVGTDAEQAAESYGDTIQGIDGTFGIRRFTVTLNVPLPTPVELVGEVEADASESTVSVR